MVFLAEYYLLIKALHIISVIFWIAGLFMLPRYLAYQCQYDVGSNEDRLWNERADRLRRIILHNAVMAAWVFGLMLAVILGKDAGLWFYFKLVFIVILTAYHGALVHWHKAMTKGERPKTEKFFRIVNEIPAFITIIVVILVVVKPFS